MMPKVVCLLGFAPSTRNLIMQEPEDGREFWSLNQGHNMWGPEMLKRFTRWFQVHPWEEMVTRQTPENNHLNFLKTCNIPVYLEELNPEEAPTGVLYPYGEITSMLGGVYLTSALSFMLALAIYERFDEIRIYGVDMASNTEYEDQRPCFEWLLGVALGLGIKVWLPPGCQLLKGPLYAKTVYVTTSYIEKRMRWWIEQREVALGVFNEMVGRVKAAEEMRDKVGALDHGLLAQWAEERDIAQARYNMYVGRVAAGKELLNTALKGDGTAVSDQAHSDRLMQGANGNLHLKDNSALWSLDHLLLSNNSIAATPRPAPSLENLTEIVPPTFVKQPN